MSKGSARLNELERKAVESGFMVERDSSTMILGRSGFKYLFKTDVSRDVLNGLIQDAESFMRDIERLFREEC